MTSDDTPCRCCGIQLQGEREKLRRCILCDMCDRRHAISRDLTDAMCMVDPSIITCEVTCDQDALDPEHLMINVTGRAPTLGQTVMAPEVEIPDSVMRGPRGQA